jgi:ABC-type transport system substrate-binding protein
LITKSKTLLLCTLLILSAFALPTIMLVRSQGELFQMTLIVPGPNPARKAWAEVVKTNLVDAGIGATTVNLDWDIVYSRALTPDPSVVGKTYADGGFDALFVGYAMGIDPDPYGLFHSSQFPPEGQNYYLWDNAESDRLCDLIKETSDEATRLQYVKEWQKVFYDEQPAATLLYTKEVVAFNPTVLKGEPFEAYHYPAWPRAKNWELNPSTPETTIVLAQTGPAPSEGINPLLTTSYYDLTVYDNIFDSLAEREDCIDQRMIPALATSWEVAADEKTWTVHLRSGVTWHDGTPFTGDDVKFTFDSYMNAEIASPVGAFTAEILGSPANVVVVDANTVEFRLPKVYAYFVESFLSTFIIPKHVLENVAPGDWRTHPFNSAAGTYTVGGNTYYGPIGTGPYLYAAYDPTTFANIMTKNHNYWNKAALEAAGKFGIETLYVQFIEASDPAIAALKAGDVHVLDSQYHVETKLASIEAPWGDYISYDAYGVQELGFNMQHPVFGTGVDTPLGKSDPSKAAEAARYVRQAISHLIPRQDIIDTIIDGYGSPGLTTAITRVTAGYDESLNPYSYDVQLAKSLLAAAGYETGVPPPGDFLSQYGLYIAVIVVVVVVAVAAIYFVKKR